MAVADNHDRDDVVTAEMLAYVGRTTAPVTYHIRQRDIDEFCAAIEGRLPGVSGDADDARADADVHAHALPTIVRSLLAAPFDPPFPEPFLDILDGGSDYRFFRPIRAGDEITVVREMKEVYTKQGRLGTMLFKISETTYCNSSGEKVATQMSTSISYGRRTKPETVE